VEIRLLESAKEDLRDGWAFFERQSDGLGDYFLDCIQSDVSSLHVYAGVHETADGLHRMLSKRFPFAVYYETSGNRIDEYAILDCRRDPEWIIKRLESSRTK
jgi:hypothetical protein